MHLVILGHPSSNSLSDSLGRAYVQGLEKAGVQVELLLLRDLNFDPNLKAGFSGEQPLEPDLREAQLAIERATHVAWFFPTWWAGPPALVKAFIDRAFLPGWAFAYDSGSAFPKKLLSGRSARVTTTMDSPSFWYFLWHFRAVHASFVNATLRFVGFGQIWTTTFYQQRTQATETRKAWLAKMARIGEHDGRRTQNSLRASKANVARTVPGT